MEGIIDRDIFQTILSRIRDREIIAIRGPRQAGKSTLLKMIMEHLISTGIREEEITSISFEDPVALDEFRKDPRKYLGSFINGGSRHYFLLDEVQYDSDAGKRLKLLYDTMENAKFFITGSSTLDVSSLSKFLVGRVFLYELLPLNFWEYLHYNDERLYRIFSKNTKSVRMFALGDAKDANLDETSMQEIERHFEDYLKFGGYPEVVKRDGMDRKVEVLKNIYSTYIEKDVAGVFGITDSFKLRKTVTALAAGIGSVLSYESLSSYSETYYASLMRYLNILEDTYIIKRIFPYHKSRKVELRKSPKVYFVDIGLRNYIIQNFNDIERREDAGHVLENFVFSELFSRANPTMTINFWRTLAKAEVDFVISEAEKMLPIEVKYGISKPEIPRGFSSFIDTYAPKKAIVATRRFISKKDTGNTNIVFVPAMFL